MTKVCIAHDYVSQRGGAERVALAMLKAFPGAPLVTSVYEPQGSFPGFRGHEVRTSRLQNVPLFRKDPRLALPLLASTWGKTKVTSDDADVVLASSSGWAHGLSVDPDVKVVVYCHNPARWLYQGEEYFAKHSLRAAALSPMQKALTKWDRAAAHRASLYLANSTIVAKRVKSVYGIDAEVLPPPVSVDVHGSQEPVPGLEPGYLITVARGRGYKNTSVVEEAVQSLPGERLVVVGGGVGHATSDAGSSVLRLGVVSDAQLRWLYANARALVSVSYEDFGLTPLEANAFGTPAVLLRAGGFLDTLDEGVSGIFVEAPTAEAVRTALLELPDLDRRRVAAHAQKYSESEFRAKLHAVVDQVMSPREKVLDLRSPRVVDIRRGSMAAARS